jgi:hypothetical protein
MIASLTSLTAVPVAAEELAPVATLLSATATSSARPSPLFPAQGIALSQASATSAPDFSRIRRPAALPALYAATVVTQVLDVHSTMKAMSYGAQEANPVMKGVAGNGGAMLAVKAGATAGVIVLAEKMWRRNRTAAIAMMVAVNAVTGAVAAHNYSVAKSLR